MLLGEGSSWPHGAALVWAAPDACTRRGGLAAFAGDSSSVSAELTQDIVTVVGTSYAFAALNKDGKVITWGHSSYGGDPLPMKFNESLLLTNRRGELAHKMSSAAS